MTPPPSFTKYWLIYPERKRLSLQQQAHSMLTFSLIFFKTKFHFTNLETHFTLAASSRLSSKCYFTKATVLKMPQTQKSELACGLWKLLTNFHSHHQQLSSELKVSTDDSLCVAGTGKSAGKELKRMCSHLWLLPVFVTGSSGKATAKSEPLTCFLFLFLEFSRGHL